MAGYNRKRYAEGILDLIELNAVAFNDGESTSVIIMADFVGITQERISQIKKLIEDELGIPANNAFIAATHTHTAIRFSAPEFTISPVSAGTAIDDENYIAVLLRKFVDVARLAVNDMSEATFSVGEAQTSRQISFVRRFLMKNGEVRSFPKYIPDPNIVRALGDPDNTLRLVRITREGAKDIAIANFSTHPDTTTGSLFSADWPGHSRRYFEEEHPDVNCIMLVGPQGDTNHIDVTLEGRQYGPDKSREIGRVIADAINEAWKNTNPIKTDKIATDARVVYNRSRTDGLEKYDECMQFLEDYYAKRIKAHAQEIAAARRVVNIRNIPVFRTVPVSAMKVGDIAFVGFGGEAFTEYANRTRASQPDKYVISITCCNGYQGYLPTRSAYEDGGYESGSSAFSTTLEEEVVGEAIDMLNKLYE
jgi:hypothetical protein